MKDGERNERHEKYCPKIGKPIPTPVRHRWLLWILPLTGFVSLVWFLVRVIPKPSRAGYPCQRAAFPLASGFVVWIVGLFTSLLAFKKAKQLYRKSRFAFALICLGVAFLAGIAALYNMPEKTLTADDLTPNVPIGTARGLHPGRVVWVHDPAVTDWNGVGDGMWYDHIDQAVVDRMFSKSIRGYAGLDDLELAWDTIFRHFNQQKGKGDVGYQPGEKIAMKINWTLCNWGDGVDANYNKNNRLDNIDNAPQLLHALLHHLVNIVGVAQSDISMGDPTCFFANHVYNYLHNDFPDVHYMDNGGTQGRELVQLDTNVKFYWSTPAANGTRQDYVPTYYTQAAYFINCPILKSHDLGGITVNGKNHFGSFQRTPAGSFRGTTPTNPSYFNLHSSDGNLPGNKTGMGYWRPMVDLMGHEHMGGKTLLCLVDGIYGGYNWYSEPSKWAMAPFNNNWPCSIFVSMDQVAMDSVAFDFLIRKWSDHAGINGTTDYLVEAASCNPTSPTPSGTYYDPEGDGTYLSSLGTYEHWYPGSTDQNKLYSRNLDPAGTGIQLLALKGYDPDTVVVKTGQTPVIDGTVDPIWDNAQYHTCTNVVLPVGGSMPAPADFSGGWKALWDDDYLYFLVELNDDEIVQDSPDTQWWEDDNVEFFIDADNSKGGETPVASGTNYDSVNDFEFGIRPYDTVAANGSNSVQDNTGVDLAVSTDGIDGWRLEIRFPWDTLGIVPMTGSLVGLDIHITDDDDGGNRDLKVSWHSLLEHTFRDASIFGTFQLVAAHNFAPTVDAGADQETNLVAGAALEGQVTDDGNPRVDPMDPLSPPMGLTYMWHKISGPGEIIFAEPNAVETTAAFTQAGLYKIGLTAFDGELPASDDLLVSVRVPGDMDGDNDVLADDLSRFLARWLADNCNSANDWCDYADIDHDHFMNLADFGHFSRFWITTDTTPPERPTGLAAESGNALVELDWNANLDLDLAGYNVYRSETSGGGYVKVNTALLTESQYTDSSVTNGTTYYYVITAVDQAANESEYSDEASATPVDVLLLYFESENGSGIAGNWSIVSDGTASGGQYLEWTGDASFDDPPGSDQITYPFTAPTTGLYKVYFRVKDTNTDNDSVWVRIDGTDVGQSVNITRGDGWVKFNSIDHVSTWTWDQVHNQESGNSLVQFYLPADTHTIRIGYREAGTKMDQMFITDTSQNP
jgi:cellulose/xylan binding protein with CBM9 domain/uncharacterized protein DUF362